MNPYEVLGVSPSSSDAEIRKAYVGLARRFHPDLHGGADERMRQVNEAWSILGDARRRADYDRVRHHEPPPDPGFRPDDPVDDGFDPRDLADVPYRPRPPQPHQGRELATVAPVFVFVGAVSTATLGYFFDSPAIIGAGVVLFTLACVGMAVVLLTAMVDARRDEG